MSMKLAVECWSKILSHAEYKVLTALCDEADDDGRHCYPGIPYLVWKTGYNERNIHRTLRDLEDKKYIEVALAQHGRGNFNEYTIFLDRVPNKKPWREVKHGKMSAFDKRKAGNLYKKDGQSVQERVTSSTVKGDISSTKTADLPHADQGNAIRPVVNPTNNPLSDPDGSSPVAARFRELRAASGTAVAWSELTRKQRDCWRASALVLSQPLRGTAYAVFPDAATLGQARASPGQRKDLAKALAASGWVCLGLELVGFDEWEHAAAQAGAAD